MGHDAPAVVCNTPAADICPTRHHRLPLRYCDGGTEEDSGTQEHIDIYGDLDDGSTDGSQSSVQGRSEGPQHTLSTSTAVDTAQIWNTSLEK